MIRPAVLAAVHRYIEVCTSGRNASPGKGGNTRLPLPSTSRDDCTGNTGDPSASNHSTLGGGEPSASQSNRTPLELEKVSSWGGSTVNLGPRVSVK
jgi:hypothetical protein